MFSFCKQVFVEHECVYHLLLAYNIRDEHAMMHLFIDVDRGLEYISDVLQKQFYCISQGFLSFFRCISIFQVSFNVYNSFKPKQSSNKSVDNYKLKHVMFVQTQHIFLSCAWLPDRIISSVP